MKRTFIALLVSASAVWTWVAVQVLMTFLGPSTMTREGSALSGFSMAAAMVRPAYASFRDPFQSFLYADKPAAPKPVAASPRSNPVPEEAPNIKVNGIMLGDAPMAILEQDGKTEFARPGQEIFGFQVRSVEAGKVVLKRNGKAYTLTYP